MNTSIIILTTEAVVFYLLYLYLEETLPNEYGTHKRHFWFLRKTNKHPIKETSHD